MEIEITKVQGLLRAKRPGYPGKSVDEATVATWVAEAQEKGIRTILCLLDDDQLEYYNPGVPGGLLRYYRTKGFDLVHHPVADHRYPPVPDDILALAYSDFLRAEKPAVVHCSAGIDRTGAVVNFLLKMTKP